MNMNDIIEDYLLGNLSAEEKQTFEKELAINADLQKEVELHRILITEVQAFNAVQAAEAAYLKEQQEPIGTKQDPSPKVITWNFKRIASIAACFLIVMGGYNVWLHQYTISVGQDTYSPSHSSSNVPTLIENEQYDAALEALNQDLAMVDEIMSKIDNHALRELRERLLLEKANVYLMQGERTQAKDILEDLYSPKAHELLDKLHWYSPVTNLFKK
jgi:anti-sigma factor RsiW